MRIDIDKVFLSSEFRPPYELLDTEDTTDVIVYLKNGNKYVASFFPYKKIDEIRENNIISGEYLGGKYFWAMGMLLIEECSRDLIGKVLGHLIEDGDFENVFIKLN